jgi:hypothetical protein
MRWVAQYVSLLSTAITWAECAAGEKEGNTTPLEQTQVPGGGFERQQLELPSAKPSRSVTAF